MTETGCKNLYGTCRFSVTTLVALACFASTASAGTFSEFETRCLTPMIDVRASVTEGLTLLEEMAGRETWIAAGQDWHLTQAAPEAVVQYCAIHGTFGAEVDTWAEDAIASGDWERTERVPETLQSVFIREPLIEVEIDRAGGSLTVIETNLES